MSEIEHKDQEPRRVEIVDIDEQGADSSDANESGRLQRELEDLRDRSLRTLADYENYRKRVQREKEEERRYAGIDLLRELLTVVDNLERAAAAEGSVEELKEGVALILRQLHELLRRSGVRRVPAAGEPFDPNVHEAVRRQEDAGVVRPTVVAEHQAGFWMHDRLLRPAVVTVAVPDEAPAPTEPESQDR